MTEKEITTAKEILKEENLLSLGFKNIGKTADRYFGEGYQYKDFDAFIDKALAYLHDKFYFSNVFYGIVSTNFNAMEEMFEDFRTYMEG